MSLYPKVFVLACCFACLVFTIEANMKMTSTAFEHEEKIPSKYTCEGSDVSPQLSFIDVPTKAKSLVLIVDDPDAPRGTFDHWITFNISPDTKELAEGVHTKHNGTNGFGDTRYRGPCPPRGSLHRYFFKLYALDKELDLPEGATKTEVLEAMKGHILKEATLLGLYGRQS